MQSEQYNNQTKLLRSDSRSSGESNTTSVSCCDAALDHVTMNKRDTINSLINTLQLIRDSDESAIAPATMDALNSMGEGVLHTHVPALQAVPYIVPQQKLVNFLEIFVETLYGKIYSKYFAQDCPSWSETRSNNLQSPQLFQQQALPNPYAITTPPQLDSMNATSPLRGVGAFSIFPLQNPPSKDETSQELLGSAATAPTSLNARVELVQRQKNKAIQKLKMVYGPQASVSQVQSLRGTTPVTPLPKFPPAQAYTAPAATRARKGDFPAPGEPTAIRKVPQYARSHGLNKATRQKRQREPVVVDSSVRECNEWSIYSVPLPTQLHVKCHCFSADS
ncbi:unnamed protein product [Heligmosomoides polygyrus]|uniref:Uncharacterized protein n=1 Tax=Heligmosomoides polygyrus TaxID=6339 RepID=A0A3P8DGI8_HELPZ|nr:unnamed protein product [Heligmosomoides polygyrus]